MKQEIAPHVRSENLPPRRLEPERWFRRSRNTTAAKRLFCFPHAGGSARIFRNWHDWLAPEVEVVAVELPGRGVHLRSPLIDRMEIMIEHLMLALDPLLDVPFAVFGHSMGSLIAFELCRALKDRQRRTPMHLFVAGMPAPHAIQHKRLLHRLSDDQLLDAVQAMNGTPAETLAHTDIVQPFLPILRADLRLAETYQYVARPPLAHPITVFAGLHDDLAPAGRMHEWAEHTAASCTVRMLQGDHFFTRQHEHVLAASIMRSLRERSSSALPPQGPAHDQDFLSAQDVRTLEPSHL